MVEDEEVLRVPVATMLRRQGFAVVETADGSAAVELFRERSGEIDVVFLDMTLPGISGAEVMALMSLIRPNIKVILTSAYCCEAVTEALRGQSPAAFIRKPYTSAQLAELLRATSPAKAFVQSA